MPSNPVVLGSLFALMTKVLGATFLGVSWSAWRALLRAVSEGLDVLSPDEQQLVARMTGRTRLPASPRELWFLIGRRAGKSIIAALIAIWATCCRAYTLAPGEVGVFMIIAADRRQSRVVKRYISGLLRSVAVLEQLIADETNESITLANGLMIEIHTCSYRTLRGYTCIGAVCDEICFWDDENSANPDREVLVALRAAMATVPEALLVALSSTYARRGEAWKAYEKCYGRDDSERVLVINAPTQVLNPTISQETIDAAYEEDPQAAAAEYGAEWRPDIETFIPLEVLKAAVQNDRYEIPPIAGVRYLAFCDPSGGSGQDSFTLAIAHEETGRLVLDCVCEIRPPFSPDQATRELASVIRRYRLTSVSGDRYAGSWPEAAFRQNGVSYYACARTKSDLYVEFLPLLMAGRVELLDLPRVTKQFGALERKTSRSGKDSVDHPPRQHDDLANAVAGALVYASERATRGPGIATIKAPGARDGLGRSHAMQAVQDRKAARLLAEMAPPSNPPSTAALSEDERFELLRQRLEAHKKRAS